MPSEVMPDLDLILTHIWLTCEQTGQKDYETIKKAVKEVATFAANRAATVALGSLGPITMAVGAWIGAAQVASRISSNGDFWDMMPVAKRGSGLYNCSCATCVPHLEFIISQQETKVMKIALTASVVGAIPAGIHSGYTKYKGKVAADKLQAAQAIRRSALPIGRKRKYKTPDGKIAEKYEVLKPGCRKAQAIIATLLGEHTSSPADYKKTLAAIVASDGWIPIKNEID